MKKMRFYRECHTPERIFSFNRCVFTAMVSAIQQRMHGVRRNAHLNERGKLTYNSNKTTNAMVKSQCFAYNVQAQDRKKNHRLESQCQGI